MHCSRLGEAAAREPCPPAPGKEGGKEGGIGDAGEAARPRSGAPAASRPLQASPSHAAAELSK